MNWKPIALGLLIGGSIAFGIWHQFSVDDLKKPIAAKLCEDDYWRELELRFDRSREWLGFESPQARHFQLEIWEECYKASGLPHLWIDKEGRFWAADSRGVRLVTQ